MFDIWLNDAGAVAMSGRCHAGHTDMMREVLERPGYRDALRRSGMAFSAYYTLEREREYLLRALGLTRESSKPEGADG